MLEQLSKILAPHDTVELTVPSRKEIGESMVQFGSLMLATADESRIIETTFLGINHEKETISLETNDIGHEMNSSDFLAGIRDGRARLFRTVNDRKGRTQRVHLRLPSGLHKAS